MYGKLRAAGGPEACMTHLQNTGQTMEELSASGGSDSRGELLEINLHPRPCI